MVQRISRDDARSLLHEWVESESLRRHCEAVATAMAAYAREGGHDEELWFVTGLLHDADYERYPDLESGHPRFIIDELRLRHAPDEMITAIAAHAPMLGVPATTPMDHTLRAVDELSGFLVACAMVRPGGIVGLTPKSVKKKLKQPSFAAAVNRDDVRAGADELGVDFDSHVAFVIAALEARADELELTGAAA
ncbi:MAG: HDIG domain-containing protein [Solirubrobacteraceae bacterium]|nr:HDIG domain-containing protein [Solirubrobacteraceae bacterium]